MASCSDNTCSAICRADSSSKCGGCDRVGCQAKCSISCVGSCEEGCGDGCKEYCKSNCNSNCKGCRGCSSCTSCTSCSGCSSCTGGCTSCTGCTGSCSGKCNSKCTGTVAEQAYQALVNNGLSEYITEEDINNIYLVFQAVKNRRIDADKATSFTDLTFTKDEKQITDEDTISLITNATNVGYTVNKDKVIQDNIIDKTTYNELMQKAISAYENSNYPRA